MCILMSSESLIRLLCVNIMPSIMCVKIMLSSESLPALCLFNVLSESD